MNNKAIILLAGGLGAAYLVARSAINTTTALKRLSWNNPTVKIKNVGLLNSELLLTLDIYNPASVDVPLDYFTGTVAYNGKPISNFTFNANGKNTLVKARTTTTIPFTVIVKNVNAVATFLNLVKSITTGKPINTIVGINGSLYAAGFDVPVAFNYDVKNGTVEKFGLSGIGGVEAKLQFSSNAEMEKYFFNKKASKKLMFSKN